MFQSDWNALEDTVKWIGQHADSQPDRPFFAYQGLSLFLSLTHTCQRTYIYTNIIVFLRCSESFLLLCVCVSRDGHRTPTVQDQ